MTDDPSATPTADTPSTGPDAAEARGWIGSRLDEIGGAAVAKIEGFFADPETGRPEWLVVRLGRFGQHGLVPAREAVGVGGRVWIPYSRDAIKGAAKTNTKAPLTREGELELLEHFGAGGDAGRAAELSARGSEAITAGPAT